MLQIKTNAADVNVGKVAQAKAKPASESDYKAAVAQAKQILAEIDRGWWQLGELADKVTKKYGEQRLKRFADDIGIGLCTLERRRSVYRAWSTNEAPAPKSYAVAQELQAVEGRFELIKQNPNMTKREAREIKAAPEKSQSRTEQAGANPAAGHRLEETKRWFRSVVEHSREALSDAAFVNGYVEPELRRVLREGVDATLREAGEAYIRLVEFLEKLLANEDEPREQFLAQAAE